MPSKRVQLYGPILLVRDIRKAVAFYRDRIGLKGDAAGPWAEFRNGASRLVLLDRGFWANAIGAARPSSRSATVDTFVLAVRVPDVRVMYARLRRQGVRFDSGPIEVPQMGVRVALLRDPDGHQVELSTMLTKKDMERLAKNRVG